MFSMRVFFAQTVCHTSQLFEVPHTFSQKNVANVLAVQREGKRGQITVTLSHATPTSCRTFRGREPGRAACDGRTRGAAAAEGTA